MKAVIFSDSDAKTEVSENLEAGIVRATHRRRQPSRSNRAREGPRGPLPWLLPLRD